MAAKTYTKRETVEAEVWTLGATIAGVEDGFECISCKCKFQKTLSSVCIAAPGPGGCSYAGKPDVLIEVGLFVNELGLQVLHDGDSIVTDKNGKREAFDPVTFAAKFEDAATSVTLKSPSGARFDVTVNDLGVLTTKPAP